LGAGKVVAVKWTWALATVGAGLAMYAYARRTMGRQRGLLAAVVYVYAPYHLADIYVRAALAEYCAFVWMPLALLSLHHVAEAAPTEQGWRRIVPRVTAFGLTYGALWLAHNPTGLASTPLLAAYVLYRLGMVRGAWRDRLRGAASALAGAVLGLGIAAALLLPNLFERTFINQEQWVRAGYDYAVHFVYPFQFFASFWGYAPAAPGPGDGMSFQLGVVPTILAMVAFVGAWRRPLGERSLILFYTGATVVLILLMLPIAAPVWAALPIAALVQFPWRLLALTAVTLAILAGFAIPRPLALSSSRGPYPELSGQMLVLALVALLASFPYTLPQYTPVPDIAEGPLLTIEFEREYDDMVGMTAWTQELPTDSPLVDQYRAGGPLVTAEALAEGASVEMIRAAGASDELWVDSEVGTTLRFYTYYFPGWRVYVDGERLPESALRPETPYGLLAVDIPLGRHRVLLRWGDTPLRLTGKIVSLVSLALACSATLLPVVVGQDQRPALQRGGQGRVSGDEGAV
jgi:hypothetical protein